MSKSHKAKRDALTTPDKPSKPKPEGYVFGRPTDYDKKYCRAIVEFCKKGGFLEEFAQKLDLHIDTLREWKKKHPDFSVAYKKAKAGNKNWLLEKMRLGLQGKIKGYNLGANIFLAKALHSMSEDGDSTEQDDETELEFED